MITVKNIKTLDDQIIDLQVISSIEQTIEAEGRLLLLPGMIDSHMTLGTPNQESWVFTLESAIRGESRQY